MHGVFAISTLVTMQYICGPGFLRESRAILPAMKVVSTPDGVPTPGLQSA